MSPAFTPARIDLAPVYTGMAGMTTAAGIATITTTTTGTTGDGVVAVRG